MQHVVNDSGGEEMVSVEERERIRRAYFIEGLSIRAIAREFRHGRRVVREALRSAEPAGYNLEKPREAPVLGPYRARIDELLEENKRMPRKQRYTGRKIYEILKEEGYTGSDSTLRRYIAEWRKQHKQPQVYLPLEFDPGSDAQVDWGEPVAVVAGERVTVQFFVMRLNYSRALFVMAFPTQKQECFFEGHVQAFRFFGSMPRRITYDNLRSAVYRSLEGRNRQEQQAFIGFRSHYLFESFHCTPRQAHEKGGVEHGVGYARRNFLVPIPKMDSFEDLNTHWWQACREDMDRRVWGQKVTIREALERERLFLVPLPDRDFLCCVSRPVTVNRYSQVTFEYNRYSVPITHASRQLVLRAFPFRVEILCLDEVVATHHRCYGREQEIFEPFHYLSLLEQRPGAFDHAKPIRRWCKKWPPVYERFLERVQQQGSNGQGIREFVRVLKLHRDHPAKLVTQAVEQALDYGCIHADGVELCLRQFSNSDTPVPSLDLADIPPWAAVGEQPPDLTAYDRLLERA
jgi:transposase